MFCKGASLFPTAVRKGKVFSLDSGHSVFYVNEISRSKHGTQLGRELYFSAPRYGQSYGSLEQDHCLSSPAFPHSIQHFVFYNMRWESLRAKTSAGIILPHIPFLHHRGKFTSDGEPGSIYFFFRILFSLLGH